jgi:hypothetical protein
MPPDGRGDTRSLFANKSAERARFTRQIAQVHPSTVFIYSAMTSKVLLFGWSNMQFKALLVIRNFLKL